MQRTYVISLKGARARCTFPAFRNIELVSTRLQSNTHAQRHAHTILNAMNTRARGSLVTTLLTICLVFAVAPAAPGVRVNGLRHIVGINVY
jgi:hypothetical protein